MRSRFVLYALVATVFVGGIAFAADALVESDRDQLEELATALTSGRPHGRTDAVLRWTDLSREPISITRGRSVQHFDERDDHRLAETFARVLAPFTTDNLDVVQRSISVKDDRAIVALRVRADGKLVDVSFRLAKSGQGWLVTQLRVL